MTEVTDVTRVRPGGTRVVVTGAAGMLGTAVIAALRSRNVVVATDLVLGERLEGVTWEVLDLRDAAALQGWMETVRPDVVVHCAGIVDVDACEAHPDLAQAVHVKATEVLARALGSWGGRLMYISTDSVFDGEKEGPYVESDRPAPRNEYARTKLRGEAAAALNGRALILRTNIFGWTPSPRQSFAEWIIHGLAHHDDLGMFDDVFFTPVHVAHLAGVIEKCIGASAVGLFHAAGDDTLSKYEFALEAADVFGLSAASVRARSVEDAGLAAARPRNMALSSRALCSRLATRIPGAREGLRVMRAEYEEGWAARIKGRETRPPWDFEREAWA